MSISGKPKEICIQALRLAGGDPNRAFEVIMSIGNIEEGDMIEGEYGDDGYGDEEGSSMQQPGAVDGDLFSALA